jgi:tetratricopeptide (TPR) repeat protein
VYRALIVCNSRFPEDAGALGELHGPKRDSVLLRDALTDHIVGMFEKDDVLVLNEEGSPEVTRAIDDFFSSAEPDDTLLFYYSGHGRTINQQLYLCARNTLTERLRSTAIPEATLDGIVSNSFAQVKILILDCCHSGMLKGSNIIEGLSGTGRYVIAATSAIERASDASLRGMPSPFTRVLVDALLSKATDRDGDGFINLDDVYSYLETARFEGPRPHRIFDGSGSIPIGRRTIDTVSVRSDEKDQLAARAFSSTDENNLTIQHTDSSATLPYLDILVPGASYSSERVAEFRGSLREDISKTMPSQLSVLGFLEWAGLLRHGQLTYTGVLLFGDNPTATLPAAMVQCARFYGTTKKDPLESLDIYGTVPEMIIKARDFVANIARFGEAPTAEGAYAETVYRYPMIAVREIIANAIVHRDYKEQESCVQIFVFADRIEVISPGKWGGTREALGTSLLGQLERQSQRRNFRLARTLAWSKLVEGVGAGVPRAIADCQAIGVPEPMVINDDQTVTVTIFPRPVKKETSKSPSSRSGVTSAPVMPRIWGHVPLRNRNFTGREQLLDELQRRVTTDNTVLLPYALYGLGGVGKTQLAIEYAYRYSNDYEVVWWIQADQPALIRSSFAELAPRLGITGLIPGRVEDAAAAAFDALRRGSPSDRWLLIFDNADQPEEVRIFMPPGPGHIIITSRNRGWAQVIDTIEVDVFTRSDSQKFLSRRISGITDMDADRLAEELGDLPLALDQAASFLMETALTVDTYLQLMHMEGSRVLAENPMSDGYPLPIAAAWSLSVTRLREQDPNAMKLLQLCAFFGAAPISLELLERGRYVLDSPLKQVLSDSIMMSRALRALSRYSLARIDNHRRTLEVHRIIQRLIRDELAPDDHFNLRHEVHLLLAAADPGGPDKVENWQKYADLLAHVGPAEALICRVHEVRKLVQNVVDYLYSTANYTSALSSAEQALAIWTRDSGQDDVDTLIMNRLKSQILRGLARYQESYDLTIATMRQMQTVLGEDHEETLILMNGHCADLRVRGEFKSSLEFTTRMLERHQTIIGVEDPRSFDAMSRLAEDLELNSDYSAAARLHEQIYEEKRAFYARDDHPAVLFTLNAWARTVREQGKYTEALEMAEVCYSGYRELVREKLVAEDHPWVLESSLDLVATRSAVGKSAEGLELAHQTHERYRRSLGGAHPNTLVAAISLGNGLRVSGDLKSAGELMEGTLGQYRSVLGNDHPYTMCCALDLAIVRRRQGIAQTSRKLLEEVKNRLTNRLGQEHHYTLACIEELGTTFAALGEANQAVEIYKEALRISEKILGVDHPDTLTCAANLALHLRTVQHEEQAAYLASDIYERFQRVLGGDHPKVRSSAEGQPVDFDISPTIVL